MPALELTLPQIAKQEADGTITFIASGVSTIATSQSSFMIFYLTQEDEQNGYGTVIQLDEQHRASIYPDLNPEYTYLFYKNDQQQLQSLLWCIEFATRTDDGLYVTQAKVHGRGVTQEDMDRFNQIMLTPAAPAQPQHNLSETYSATPAASSAVSPEPVTPQPIPSPAPDPISEASEVLPSLPTTQPNLPQLPAQPEIPAPVSPAPQQPTPPQTPPAPPAMPDLLTLNEVPTLSLPALTPLEPTPAPTTPPPAALPTSTPAAANTTPISFPSLPPLPQMPTPQPAAAPLPALPDQTYSQPSRDAAFGPDATTATPASPAPFDATNKNPVGRPPKPLLTDAAWTVDQLDFAWAKSISRDSIQQHQSELRQRVQKQIQLNQPELINNAAFQTAFNQAFTAICQTYELTPTARQDILKSLLNGRIVENISKTI